MVAIANLLNREAAAGTTLAPKDAERLVARVATAQGKVMEEAGYAVVIASRSLSNARMAEIFGKATSTITLYRRGGVFLVVGGDTESDTWRVLMSKSKANDKRVGAVIDKVDLSDKASYKASLAAIEAVVSEHFKPDGKPVVAPAKPDANPSGEGEGDLPPLTKALALVKALTEIVPALGPEEFSTLETAMHKVISDHVADLKVAAETTRKGKGAAKASA